MSMNSLAAQAVANSPGLEAPASFNGAEWLIALNLWEMTAGFLVALMAIVTLLSDGWLHRFRERPGVTLPRIWRVTGLLFATGFMLRCGGEALTLWGWDIDRPAQTGTFLFVKRLLDPVAVTCGISGLALFILALPGVLEQLRREPPPLDLWQTWPIVRRMVAVAVLCLIAAVGVTVTR